MLNFYVLKKNFDPYLKLWLEERKKRGIESDWLFPDHDDPSEHVDASLLNSWAKTFSKILGAVLLACTTASLYNETVGSRHSR